MKLWNSLTFVAILVGLAGGGDAAGKDQPAAAPASASRVVYLGKSPGLSVKAPSGEARGILVREFFRQSLLLAAREELGLVTRDAWLGDTMPREGWAQPLELVTRPELGAQLDVLRGSSATAKVAGTVSLPLFSREEHHKRLFLAAEELSRTGFPEILKQQYGVRQRRVWKADLGIPSEVDGSLREMSFLAQFKAVRQTHDLMAVQGESPAMLGALVRGYANLGVLTESHWHPAHKVFKARAILYAQRWLARQPESLPALWHRAYALTLTGLHVEAMADLESAHKAWQAKAEKGRPSRPGWVALLEACCHYDVERLSSEEEQAEHGPLAALLHYHTVELGGNQAWAFQTGLATLAKIPECYRVYDGLYTFSGMVTDHGATVKPFEVLGQTLYRRVRDMPGIPPSVRREADRPNSGPPIPSLLLNSHGGGDNVPDEFAARARLIAALRTASRPQPGAARPGAKAEVKPVSQGDQQPCDLGEPSWEALARLVQEVSFLHVWRHADFLSTHLRTPSDAFRKLARPLVADHPLRLFFDGLTWNMTNQREVLDRIARLEPAGLELNAECLLYPLAYTHEDRKKAMYLDMYDHRDDLPRDCVILCRLFSFYPEIAAVHARRLLEVSPHSPLGRALLVDARLVGRSRAAEWGRLAPKYPALACSLAGYYAASQQPDEALRFAQMALKTVDEPRIYLQLADLYLQKGDEDRWLKTLEKGLAAKDYGGGHAAIRAKLAEWFVHKKEWKRALPYAEAGADRSGDGLVCAANCYEGLQEWEKAEQYWRRCAQRYDSSSLMWYYFCRRTGKGNLQDARQLAQGYLDKTPADQFAKIRFDAVVFYILDKQLEKALAIYRDLFAERPDPFFGLAVATLSDELKDSKTRDAALARIRTFGPTYVREDMDRPRKELVQLAAWIEGDLARGGKGQIDLQAVEKLLAPIRLSYEAAYTNLFLARYLQLHGKREEAIRCWKKSLVSNELPNFVRHLAGATLNDLGIKPEDYKELLAAPAKADAKPSREVKKAAGKEPQKGGRANGAEDKPAAKAAEKTGK